jgi:hypothetical protein
MRSDIIRARQDEWKTSYRHYSSLENPRLQGLQCKEMVCLDLNEHRVALRRTQINKYTPLHAALIHIRLLSLHTLTPIEIILHHLFIYLFKIQRQHVQVTK